MPMPRRSEWKPVNGFIFASADDCPDKAKLHRSDEPAGYLARDDWMRRMAQRCHQRRCPTCGYWAVWEPKA